MRRCSSRRWNAWPAAPARFYAPFEPSSTPQWGARRSRWRPSTRIAPNLAGSDAGLHALLNMGGLHAVGRARLDVADDGRDLLQVLAIRTASSRNCLEYGFGTVAALDTPDQMCPTPVKTRPLKSLVAGRAVPKCNTPPLTRLHTVTSATSTNRGSHVGPIGAH